MNTDKLLELAETLEIALRRRQNRKIDFYVPYPKQQMFFDLGSKCRERLFIAGNQVGKTETAAAEVTYHLTGDYPEDWLGRRWDRPVKGWAAGESSLLVRDIQQKKLCGEPGVENSLGTGLIPMDRFSGAPSLSRGVTDAYDTIQVKHRTNGIEDGISILKFKSYEQGRTKFQGETLDFFWCDEEPDEDIYSECLTRITATGGMGFMTLTPLKGRTPVLCKFLDNESPDRGLVNMTLHEAEHLTAEQKAQVIAGYPPHERDARVNGIPIQGEGRIFPYPDEMISEPQLTYVPLHWGKIWGIDFGIAHPFAAVLMAWDKDNDIIHVLHAIRMHGDGNTVLPINHAAAMKQIGANVPVAWPHDGSNREKSSGDSLMKSYKAQGLVMLPVHATFPEGGYSTEAGVLEMQNRMTTNRWKVASHLTQWFEEFRSYHRKDGMIVKIRDDLLSATRTGMIMRRYARPIALGGKKTVMGPPEERMAMHTELHGRDLW